MVAKINRTDHVSHPIHRRKECRARAEINASLFYREDFDVPVAPKDLDPHILRVTGQQQIDGGIENRQVGEANPIDAIGKHGPPEPDAPSGRVDFESKA
jgi:hypothetical protein